MEAVRGAVTAVNRVQKEVHADRAASVDVKQVYHEQRASALSTQEARLAEQQEGQTVSPCPSLPPCTHPHPLSPSQRLLAEERAKLSDLTAAMQGAMVELRAQGEEEKMRLAAESERISRLQQQMERERSASLQAKAPPHPLFPSSKHPPLSLSLSFC